MNPTPSPSRTDPLEPPSKAWTNAVSGVLELVRQYIGASEQYRDARIDRYPDREWDAMVNAIDALRSLSSPRADAAHAEPSEDEVTTALSIAETDAAAPRNTKRHWMRVALSQFLALRAERRATAQPQEETE